MDISQYAGQGMPEDAGQYAPGLAKILDRIPARWGKWISVSPGWYPLIIELDEKLADVEPNYVLDQVKSKFGGLRYYIELPDLPCCVRFNDHFDQTPDQTNDAQYDVLLSEHMQTPEHKAAQAHQRRVFEQLHSIIAEYEKRSFSHSSSLEYLEDLKAKDSAENQDPLPVHTREQQALLEQGSPENYTLSE